MLSLAAFCLFAAVFPEPATDYDFSKLKIEKLGRGVVAFRSGEREAVVSWRYRRQDPAKLAFNVYRNGRRITDKPLSGATFFKDETFNPAMGAVYEVKPVLDKDGNPLTSLDLSVAGVDSEEEIREDGVAENAIDGQVEAAWIASSRTLPHWIEFCSSAKAEIYGFRYTPRQNNGGGRIKDWKMFVR